LSYTHRLKPILGRGFRLSTSDSGDRKFERLFAKNILKSEKSGVRRLFPEDGGDFSHTTACRVTRDFAVSKINLLAKLFFSNQRIRLTTIIESTTMRTMASAWSASIVPASATAFSRLEFGVRVGVIGRKGRPSVEPLVTQGVFL